MRQPDWDIDLALGAQSELWVADIRRALAEKGTIEVKHDQPSSQETAFLCRVWVPRSGRQMAPFGHRDDKVEAVFFHLWRPARRRGCRD